MRGVIRTFPAGNGFIIIHMTERSLIGLRGISLFFALRKSLFYRCFIRNDVNFNHGDAIKLEIGCIEWPCNQRLCSPRPILENGHQGGQGLANLGVYKYLVRLDELLLLTIRLILLETKLLRPEKIHILKYYNYYNII